MKIFRMTSCCLSSQRDRTVVSHAVVADELFWYPWAVRSVSCITIGGGGAGATG